MEFHDGAELTSDDVKATFDRIARPPQGISSPRSLLFSAVSEIAAPDKYTVQFKLSEPRPPNFIMSAIACGWNVIIRKQTLEDNHYDLRRVEVYPGTGPFKSVRRVENELWVMERNSNYWNKGLPYLDGIEFYHALPFSPELGAAVVSGRVDYIRLTDSVTARKAAETPGMSTTAFNQSVVHAICINNKRKPFDDPRVRRALHLALDRPALIEVVKNLSPMRVGGFIYPFSDFATPEDALFKRPGYQSDPAAALTEARTLLAAAGRTNGIKDVDFLVREGTYQAGLGASCPGDAVGASKYRDQIAHSPRIDMVHGLGERQFRPLVRGHCLDAARPLRLLQRLVSRRRPAELLILEQQGIQRVARRDRP